MKLKHKIAGTILLPLAAATMATTAHAELSVGGYVAAEFSMDSGETKVGGDTQDVTGSAVSSRINFKHTNLGSSNATVLFEGDYYGGGGGNNLRLRHAVVMVDGWTVGQTWSSAANLNGILPTVDFVGLTGGSVHADRFAQIAHTIDMGSAKLKVGVEDWGNGTSGKDGPAIPDIAAGLSTNMGGLSLFGGAALVNAPKGTKNESFVHLTASAKMQVSEGMKVVASFTQSGDKDLTTAKPKNEYTAFSGGLGMDLGGGMSANAMAEVNQHGDSAKEDMTTIFVNAFYKMPSGLQFGAEVQNVTSAGYTKGSDNTNINFQGKFAF